MSSRDVDVVARLRLRADEFSSEAGKRFAEMSTRAAKAADVIRSDFLGSFAQIQKVAGQALVMPRTASGSLNLAAEIGELTQAASAADQNALALRELRKAKLDAAFAGTAGATTMREEADAAMVAAHNQEELASTTRRRIADLQAVQVELNRTASATAAVTEATDGAARQMAEWRNMAAAARADVATGMRDGIAGVRSGGLSGKSARDSAAVFEEQARAATTLQQRVDALRGAYDPLHAAQLRYNAAQENARDLMRQGAISLDDYARHEMMLQRELKGTTNAMGVHAASAGQQRAGMQQLGFQLGDVATQYSAGTAASMIFAQQSGQVIQALGMINANGNAVLKFLGGWQGAVLGAIAVAVTPFIAKMFEKKNAIEDATKKMREQAAQEAVNAQATDLWSRSIDGIISKVRDLNGELERQLRTQDQIDEGRVQEARGRERAAQSQLAAAFRERAAAQIAVRNAQIALDAAADDPRGRPAAVAKLNAAGARERAANKYIEKAAFGIGEAQEAVRLARIPLLERDVAGSRDVTTRATDRYTAALGRLRDERAKNIISEVKFQAELRKEQDIRDAAIKKAQDAARATSASDGVTRFRTREQAIGIAGRELERSGLKVGENEQFGGVKANHPGMGNAAHGKFAIDADVAGATDNAPTPPDIRSKYDAMAKRYAARGYRVLWAGKVYEPDGSVRPITSGNMHYGHMHLEAPGTIVGKATQGSTETQENREFNDTQREAAQAQKELATDLSTVVSAFDPARAAAAAYAEELERIDRLVKGNLLRESDAEDYRVAARERLFTAKAVETAPVADPASIDLDKLLDPRWLTAANKQVDEAVEHRQRREEEVTRYLADLYGDLFTGQTGNIVNNLRQLGADALGDLMAQATKDLSSKLPTGVQELFKGSVKEGSAYGLLGGSAFSTITGGRQNPMASQLGGILGDVAGKKLDSVLATSASGLLKSLGGAAGPIGAIAGSILGNVVAGLFSKPKTGSANITSTSGKATLSGTDSALNAQAGSLAGSVQQGISRIAEALGGQLGAFNVSIGTYKDTFRVNTSGGATNGKNKGFVDYGTDADAAVRAAIADAIRDGAVLGISAAAQKVLAGTTDLDKALAKALAIESIPKDLKAMLDPVGAALDALNTKWKATIAALDEGGASAEQRAQAEQLYRLQLDQVKASTASASQALKDFLVSLRVGGNSPYSLRDQQASARAQLDPYLAAINGGQTVDQSKYQEAARTFLDIERQLYGSTQAYFDSMDLIQATTTKAIAAIDNAVPITTPVENPFVKATASATATTAANTGTGNELLGQVNDTLADVRELLGQIFNKSAQSEANSFIGTSRLFSAAA